MQTGIFSYFLYFVCPFLGHDVNIYYSSQERFEGEGEGTLGKKATSYDDLFEDEYASRGKLIVIS